MAPYWAIPETGRWCHPGPPVPQFTSSTAGGVRWMRVALLTCPQNFPGTLDMSGFQPSSLESSSCFLPTTFWKVGNSIPISNAEGVKRSPSHSGLSRARNRSQVCVSSSCFPHQTTLPQNVTVVHTTADKEGILNTWSALYFVWAFFQRLLKRFMYNSSFPIPLTVKNKTLFHSLPGFLPLSLPQKEFYWSLLFKTT